MGSHIDRRSQHSDISSEIDDDEDFYEETNIEWSNLIFLPFHPTFRLIVLISVLIKINLGPIQSVYPIVFCWDVMDYDPILIFIKYFYMYACDMIYVIDTFLHMVHRQVTDKAMRRQHLPKSLWLIGLDLLALIPFFRILVSNDCPSVQLYPNIFAFAEFLVIYRIVEYFSLQTSHSFWELIVGFLLILISSANCVTCFWVLLTHHGLCENCRDNIYDWRLHLLDRLNQTGGNVDYTTYVYGMVFVTTYLLNQHIDSASSNTELEYISISVLVLLGYILSTCLIMPKVFGEAILQLRRISTTHPYVQRLIEETTRRNPSPKASKNVEKFYSMMWTKRSGITHLPDVIDVLPRYLRVELKTDLIWPLIYHSPNLKKTSLPFLRLLCESIKHDYKLPGEKFFAGPNNLTNLYFLKSGVVQIISGDEGVTSVLSVTSGTLFGDTAFFVPPMKRNVIVKCITYCEVMLLSRQEYLKALHKFSEDRRIIFKLTQERLKHAKILYSCKQRVRGLDRTEIEGISWVKRRWWEISNFLDQWKSKKRKDHERCELPPEEAVYHCAKYIGQLVLCTDAKLRTKSFFAKLTFPWILVPDSLFTLVWDKIVTITVFMVLVIYPPNITRQTALPGWFRFFQVWTDLIYVTDICISLLTSLKQQENSDITFSSVMFARCKTLKFNLDLLATIWIEYLAIIIGKPQFYNIAQSNRLIKIYFLFVGEYIYSDVRRNPMLSVLFRVTMIRFCFIYISAYLIYYISSHVGMTMNYIFGETYCRRKIRECDPAVIHVLGVAWSWFLENTFSSGKSPVTLSDAYIGLLLSVCFFLLNAYCRITFISTLYLKYRDVSNFQSFVLHLKSYFEYNKIHKDLMKRLVKYVECHWKYYKGADVLYPNTIKNEPYDIYLKVQGEVAERIIGSSKAFEAADLSLIRDLAFAGKCLILPKNSTLFLLGVESKNFTWVVHGFVKCEYHNEDDEIITSIIEPGKLLCALPAFLEKAPIRTYTACTDVEILYLKSTDFFKIIKHYPNECLYFDTCISECKPIYDEMFHTYMKEHKNYQKKLRNRIFAARRPTVYTFAGRKKAFTDNLDKRAALLIEHDFWTEPESNFIQYWLCFRMVAVIISIVASSLQGICNLG